MSPVLRPARPNDAAALARVAVSSWKAAYTGLMPPEVIARNTVEAREKRFGELLTRTGSAVLWDVLEDDGHLFGYCSYGPSREGSGPETAELYALYLLPDYWGLGHGRVLLERALDLLTRRAYTACELWVLASNVRARAFYTSAGFTLTEDDVPRDLLGSTLLEARYARSLP